MKRLVSFLASVGVLGSLLTVSLPASAAQGDIKYLAHCTLDKKNVMNYTDTDFIVTTSQFYKETIAKTTHLQVTLWEVENGGTETVILGTDDQGVETYGNPVMKETNSYR